MGSKKILLTSSYSGNPRILRLARVLRDRGFEVAVLEWDRSGKLDKRELRDGILFIRYSKKAPFSLGASVGMLGCVYSSLSMNIDKKTTRVYEIPRDPLLILTLDSALPSVGLTIAM